jgi:hypothetical protein
VADLSTPVPVITAAQLADAESIADMSHPYAWTAEHMGEEHYDAGARATLLMHDVVAEVHRLRALETDLRAEVDRLLADKRALRRHRDAARFDCDRWQHLAEIQSRALDNHGHDRCVPASAVERDELPGGQR